MGARRVLIVLGSIVGSLQQTFLNDRPCLITVLHTNFFEVVDDDPFDWILHDVQGLVGVSQKIFDVLVVNLIEGKDYLIVATLISLYLFEESSQALTDNALVRCCITIVFVDCIEHGKGLACACHSVNENC